MLNFPLYFPSILSQSFIFSPCPVMVNATGMQQFLLKPKSQRKCILYIFQGRHSWKKLLRNAFGGWIFIYFKHWMWFNLLVICFIAYDSLFAHVLLVLHCFIIGWWRHKRSFRWRNEIITSWKLYEGILSYIFLLLLLD